MRSEPQPDDSRIRAFRELYLAEFAFVWATARRLGVPPTLLEDAVQDVFMTAFRRLDEVRFEVSARAWLHGVTRRIASRYRRTAARLSRRLAAVAAVPIGPADPPQDRLAAAEQLERLLARLGGPTRAAFEMAELYGMSGPEIAGELGIPVATVYSRVRLAREQLLRELGGPGLERELSAARAREAPPPAAVQRTWAAMLPGLWTTRTGLGLAVLATTRAAVMTTLVAAAGAVAIAWPKGQVEGAASVTAGRAAESSSRPLDHPTGSADPRTDPDLLATPPDPPLSAFAAQAGREGPGDAAGAGPSLSASESRAGRAAPGESTALTAGVGPSLSPRDPSAGRPFTGESHDSGRPAGLAPSHESSLPPVSGESHDSGRPAGPAPSHESSLPPASAGSSPSPHPARESPASRESSYSPPPAGPSSPAARDRESSAPADDARGTSHDPLATLAHTTPRSGDADELAAEIAVLDRARAELARGAVAAAREHLAEHARRFPAGQFADLRGATEIELLCRQGDRAGATARAAALVVAHPRSAVAQRFKNFSCPD
ncbi:RNA polymerase sigma factor, sigma-70 family [Nannocystis exedens]|uniref:RNA polymerase sigma factor, sigma-70 family n=1 Tax=Nannocystis exedens TaxID=54 RepID=A0A1I1ZU94_9BACT|nr:sigma-70 family RNA polymerase sigma factor [Nannocystis exedens]PCC75361.1 sigma-24 (FecI-like) protein [Nannocystis exedens]SFE34100.1 RNA polymerase sigma factor, sigma-70 family [Nannocystis exedens]